MKNSIIYFFRSKLNLNIKGKIIERFIKRLKNNNIEILNIYNINNDEINIKIYKKDYDKLISLNTIYEINILNYYGIVKVKNNILDNKYIITLILLSLIVLYVLTNMIFNITIMTNDSKMSKTLINDLKELGIDKYKLKKSYKKIEEIKKQILSKHKDSLEWIEIESSGTKYIVRYEPRIINKESENQEFRHIIASRDAVIKNFDVSKGQIVKNINSYVKKGDIIVSGYIYLNENIKDTVSSTGKVYGETWYNVEVTYPYNYHEEYTTSKTKRVLVIQFLNKKIELFNFNKFKNKKVEDKVIVKNNILPIKFINEFQRESVVIDKNYNEEELIDVIINYSKDKLQNNLDNDEYIKDYKILNKTKNKDTLTLNIFFTVIENITEYQTIEEYKEENLNDEA